MQAGARGEQFAARWLEAHGLQILAKNVRTRWGECDLVARDGPVVVFVEVKWRGSAAFGAPAEAVGPGKRRRLVRLAAWYCARAGLHDRPVRFDVVAIFAPGAGVPTGPGAPGGPTCGGYPGSGGRHGSAARGPGRWRVEWLRDAFGEVR